VLRLSLVCIRSKYRPSRARATSGELIRRRRTSYGLGRASRTRNFFEAGFEFDAAQHVVQRMNFDAVRRHLDLALETDTDLLLEALDIRSVVERQMQNEFVHVERIIVRLADFELPLADARESSRMCCNVSKLMSVPLSCRIGVPSCCSRG